MACARGASIWLRPETLRRSGTIEQAAAIHCFVSGRDFSRTVNDSEYVGLPLLPGLDFFRNFFE
jgi:hypothetical protein